MAPARPARALKVHVPRHGAQRKIGSALATEIEAAARRQEKRIDIRQTTHEHSAALAVAAEQVSEWNSLLITARAERGPQWDTGTQMFLVDKGSDLYYDSTRLFEFEKQSTNEDEAPSDDRARQSIQPNDLFPGPNSPQLHRSQQQQQFPFNGSPHMNQNPHITPSRPGYLAAGSPFGSVPPGQFYGDSHSLLGQQGGMHPDAIYMGMNGSPDFRRRVTRASTMAEEGFPAFNGR